MVAYGLFMALWDRDGFPELHDWVWGDILCYSYMGTKTD